MPNVMLTQEQYDRLLRAAMFVESIQRGPVRGQEIPEQPATPTAQEVFVLITGDADTFFKPEDEGTKYYPCVLTEKVLLTDAEELEHGPLGSYWNDLNTGPDYEEGRAFALNGGALVNGNRYKATVLEYHDGQYPILAVSDAANVVHVLQVQAGAANAFGNPARIQQWNPSTGEFSDLNTTEVRVKDPNGSTYAEDDYVVALYLGPNTSFVDCYAANGFGSTFTCETITVVTAVTCEDDELDVTTATINYLECVP
jgi:hypothetical protein